MTDGVAHDVRDMLVGERVRDLAPAPFSGDEPRPAQDTQMLGDKWLRHLECFDQLVHTARPGAELAHNRDPQRVRQCSQQLGRTLDRVVVVHSQIHAYISISA